MEKVVRVARQPQQAAEGGVMKKFDQPKKKKWPALLVIGLVVALAGVGTGWVLAGSPSPSGEKKSANEVSAPGGMVQGESEAGLSDESQFEEPVEGELKKGSFEGEGTHYLDRGMGEEKNVYLVSQVLDLESFTGKKVRVWGNTLAAQKAPWLLDVGKIKVIE